MHVNEVACTLVPAVLIVGNPFHGAARSQAHFGHGCLGVNIYRLGTPRGSSAELDRAWEPCSTCTFTKLHVRLCLQR